MANDERYRILMIDSGPTNAAITRRLQELLAADESVTIKVVDGDQTGDPRKLVIDPKLGVDDDRSQAQRYAYMLAFGSPTQRESLSFDLESHRWPDPMQHEIQPVPPKNKPWYQQFDKRKSVGGRR